MTTPSPALRVVPAPAVQDPAPGPIGERGSYGFRLVVAPIAGRMRHLPPERFDGGEEWVSPGQPVALIDNGKNVVPVQSPIEGRLAGVLVRDGEPVLRGQPLVWLDQAPRDPVRRPPEDPEETSR